MSINVLENQMFNPEKAKRKSNRLFLNPEEIFEFHKSIGNNETPLIELPSLAKQLGVGNILIKDDGARFGLKAFKALGASYAMHRIIEKYPEVNTFCTATDGNHGRAVAWMAKKLNRNALIYMPKGTTQERINAIKSEGSEVIVIDKGYDHAVKIANERVLESNNHGDNLWYLIQDTAWDGYEEIPLDIMKGYWTQMHEISNQLNNTKIDLMFLQTGVGSWAASVISYAMSQWKNPPLFVSVEPLSANCVFESIKSQKRITVNNNETTIMAGLDAGTVSTLAWDLLKNSLIGAISMPDSLAEKAIRLLAYPLNKDLHIKAGESGAGGLGALLALSKEKKYTEFKNKISLNENSTILIINTESDTDSKNYNKIINKGRLKF